MRGKQRLRQRRRKMVYNRKTSQRKGRKRFKSWVWLILWLTLWGRPTAIGVRYFPCGTRSPLAGTNSSSSFVPRNDRHVSWNYRRAFPIARSGEHCPRTCPKTKYSSSPIPDLLPLSRSMNLASLSGLPGRGPTTKKTTQTRTLLPRSLQIITTTLLLQPLRIIIRPNKYLRVASQKPSRPPLLPMRQ
jgi:hypothetical protein